jgi:hypothetical protein
MPASGKQNIDGFCLPLSKAMDVTVWHVAASVKNLDNHTTCFYLALEGERGLVWLVFSFNQVAIAEVNRCQSNNIVIIG